MPNSVIEKANQLHDQVTPEKILENSEKDENAATPKVEPNYKFFSEKKKVDPQLKKHKQSLLDSIMKLSEKGS